MLSMHVGLMNKIKTFKVLWLFERYELAPMFKIKTDN
jgi:hypothetical protein